MKSYFTSTIILVLTISLMSCAIPRSNLNPSYNLTKESGVVFFSLTASGKCNLNYFVDIRHVISKKSVSISLTGMKGDIDWKKHTEECPSAVDNYDGRLIAIDLPEGTYDIYELTGISFNSQTSSQKDMVMRFNVRNNEVQYLGNVHFHINTKNFSYGVKNSKDRDFKIFKKKFKNLSDAPIKTRIIKIQNRNNISDGPTMAA